MEKKERIHVSLDSSTVDRLKQFAFEQHKSVSQAVSDMVWAQKVKNTQIRGQMSFKVK